ncbi:MAG: phosphate signaling complex protein PhoU [Gemmatimonadota bacterium]
MATYLAQSLQRDREQIRTRVLEMSRLVDQALRTGVRAIAEDNRQLAYAVILRDRFIDALENELDELCQKFLVRHQPVAGNLRYVYGIIKINNELERVGDYAKSIARHFLAVSSIEPPPPFGKIVEIANLAIPVLRNAIQAFAELDPELARATRAAEKGRGIDSLRSSIHRELIQLHAQGILPSGALPHLMVIVNRFERVGDQGGNICEEVLYMCTGEEVKHREEEILRILFVDERNACRAQMAEGIGNALALKKVLFISAGVAPETVDTRTVRFMAGKGIDISGHTAKYLNQVVDLENCAVIITLGAGTRDLNLPAGNTVSIAWEVQDPSQMQGSDEEIQAAYEETFSYLNTHIHDLVQAVFGEDRENEESRT